MSGAFETLATIPELVTPYFSIRRDRVRIPRGDVGDYWVMTRPDFAAIVVLDDIGRVCLVNAYRYPIAARKWELPQGASSKHMTLLETATQEAQQEAGLAVDDVRQIGTLHEAYGYAVNRCEVHLARLRRQGEPHPEASEGELHSAWFSPAEFWSLVERGEVTDSVTIAAVAMAARAIEARGVSED